MTIVLTKLRILSISHLGGVMKTEQNCVQTLTEDPFWPSLSSVTWVLRHCSRLPDHVIMPLRSPGFRDPEESYTAEV